MRPPCLVLVVLLCSFVVPDATAQPSESEVSVSLAGEEALRSLLPERATFWTERAGWPDVVVQGRTEAGRQ